jgi:hypothetical protein
MKISSSFLFTEYAWNTNSLHYIKIRACQINGGAENLHIGKMRQKSVNVRHFPRPKNTNRACGK